MGARPAGFFTARRRGASFFTARPGGGSFFTARSRRGRASTHYLLLITYYLLLITWGGATFFTARRGGHFLSPGEVLYILGHIIHQTAPAGVLSALRASLLHCPLKERGNLLHCPPGRAS